MQLRPYTPELYRPDSISRYRSYGWPRITVTPIPGAGYPKRPMIWGEQRLNLSGSRRRQPYGAGPVPLLGLGEATTPAGALAVLDRLDVTLRTEYPSQAQIDASAQIGNLRVRIASAGVPPTAPLPADLAREVDEVASKTWWSTPMFGGSGYPRSTVIPVLAGSAVAIGLGYWWMRSRRKAVAANRRRRS